MNILLIRYSLVTALLLYCLTGFSQEAEKSIHVAGRFYADSLRIGDVIPYSLTARYAASENVVFPDSTFDFFPFECANKKYFATTTDEGLSYDSVVYFLTTFEIDSIQTLQLPVYVIHEKDCTEVKPDPSSVRFQSLVGSMPDSIAIKDLPLKVAVAYEPVPENYTYLVAGAVLFIVLLLTGIGWLVFGKKIRKHYQLKRLQKNHVQFLNEYNISLEKMKADQSALTAEHSVSVWKKYMEKLQSQPYTKLTTRETLKIIQNEELKQNLQTIDRVIYGNQVSAVQPFEALRVFADQQFEERIKEAQHG